MYFILLYFALLLIESAERQALIAALKALMSRKMSGHFRLHFHYHFVTADDVADHDARDT